MKRFLLLLLLLSLPAFAQLPNLGGGVSFVTVNPIGSCPDPFTGPLQYNYLNNSLWGCQNGTFMLLANGASGGGGGVPLSVATFGCLPDTPPLSPLMTDNTACLTSAFAVSSMMRTTLFFPSNTVNPGYCYGISRAVQIGTTSGATYVSTDGNRQNLGANGGQGQWASCIIVVGNVAQDALDITYPNHNTATSISIKNISIQYSLGVPGNYVAPYGTVSVSGSTVTLVTATFLNFATNWVQSSGHASIYIQDSNQFGCPGNLCTITAVTDSTHLTIAQTCSSSCPTNANYSVGVGIHIIQPSWQTVGMIIDGVQVVQSGVGYSSDGGDQNPLIQNTTFNQNFIGEILNGEVAIPQWINDNFQANVNAGMLVPWGKIVLNGKADSVILESNGGPAVEIDHAANMVGGTWTNVWFEFPEGDMFHVLGSINNWNCTGCIFNFSSLNTNAFVVMGTSGSSLGKMYDITLTGGYAPNAGTGAFTVAESLSGIRQDPTGSSDPSFTSWYMTGFSMGGTGGPPMLGFQTPTTGGGLDVIMNSNWNASLFGPSSINGSIPNFVSFGPDSAGTNALVLGAPISVPTGILTLSSKVLLGPNSTPVTGSTLNVNNNLNSSGTCNTATTGKTVTITGLNAGAQLVSQAWVGQTVVVNSVTYTINSVINDLKFTVTADPGNQTGVSYSELGSTRLIVQAGPGQAAIPIVTSFPCGSLCGGSNQPSWGLNHDGFPSTLNPSNNNELGGVLALSGSGGPGGSATSATVTFTENATAAPFCGVSYYANSAPGSLPTVQPFAVVTIGPPTTLVVYGQTGFFVQYQCIKRDP